MNRFHVFAAAGLWSLSSSFAFANSIGTDFQQFNPTTSGLDFVTVQSSETLTPGVFNFGLFTNYAANALPEFNDGRIERAPRDKIRNSVMAMDLNLGVGLTSFLDMGISLPGTIFQSVEKKDQERIEYAARGLNEVRINAKLRLWGEQDYGIALIATTSLNTIEDNPMLGQDPEPTNALELAADFTIQRVAIGLNGGYRWRTPGEPIDGVPIQPFDDQVIYSAAISYYIPWADTKLIYEMFGGQAANDDPIEMQRLQKSAEGVWGLKTQFSPNFTVQAGIGSYLEQAAVTPDYRIYGGINYTIGPYWDVERKVRKKKKKPKAAPVAVETVVKSTETFVLDGVNFKFDSDFQVLPGSLDVLRQIINRIEQFNGSYKIRVVGHTDSFGDDDYNYDLGMRRAQKVRKYLIDQLKISPDKVVAESKGETEPVADNANYQGQQKNRRVEITVDELP